MSSTSTNTALPTDKNLELLARRMRNRAFEGTFSGYKHEVNGRYFRRCRRVVYGMTLIFSRDTGHHTSGWLKNPDYERCLHLSMSAAPRAIWTPDTPDLDTDLRNRTLRAFFREDLNKVWAEPPLTPAGRRSGVWHWRLFCDEHWKAIVPRGEVYSTELTEKGWKSASEIGVTTSSAMKTAKEAGCSTE